MKTALTVSVVQWAARTVVAPESSWAQLTAAKSLSLSAVEKGRPEVPVVRSLSWVDDSSCRRRANCCSSPASWKPYVATSGCCRPSESSTRSRYRPWLASAWMCSRPNQNSPARPRQNKVDKYASAPRAHTRRRGTERRTHRSGRRSRSCSSATAG